MLSFEKANFSVFHCNVDGYRKHADELDTCLELLDDKPTFFEGFGQPELGNWYGKFLEGKTSQRRVRSARFPVLVENS